MLKVIRCVVIVGNIGKSAYNKFHDVKKRWTAGYKKTAILDGAIVAAHVSCTAIVLYDPWILMRPLLMLVPIAVQYVPFVGTISIVKTIVIYGLEFIAI
jgi:hypothetical protein